MGKFVTRLIVVCNVDGAKSANGKIRYALFVKPSQVNQFLNQYTHGYKSSHVGVLKGNPRRVTCVRYFVCVGVGSASPNNCRLMGTRLRSVSVVYTGQLRSAYSKEIPGKLLACCVSVWNASARRSRIILKRDLVNCTNRHWRTIRDIYRYPRPSRISGLFKNCTRGFG